MSQWTIKRSIIFFLLFGQVKFILRRTKHLLPLNKKTFVERITNRTLLKQLIAFMALVCSISDFVTKENYSNISEELKQ